MEYVDDGRRVVTVGRWVTYRELEVWSWRWGFARLGDDGWARYYSYRCFAHGWPWAKRSWAGDYRFWAQMCFAMVDPTDGPG